MLQYYLVQHHRKAKDIVLTYPALIFAATLNILILN